MPSTEEWMVEIVGPNTSPIYFVILKRMGGVRMLEAWPWVTTM